MNTRKIVLGIITAVGVLLFLAPFAPPIVRALGWTDFAEIIDSPWELTCHRLPDRTMSILGSKMPMCSRCTGIVSGLGLGMIIGRPYWGTRILWMILAGASALLVLEMQTQEAGLHPIWHSTRILTGFLLAYPVAAAVRAVARQP